MSTAIRIHTTNPWPFEFRGCPPALVTSAAHFGVPDFNHAIVVRIRRLKDA